MFGLGRSRGKRNVLSPSENKQEPGEKWLVGGCTEPQLKPGCDGEDAVFGIFLLEEYLKQD